MLELCAVNYSSKKQCLIENICLSFASGKLYGLLGPNGSGKTTLLKVLAGLWPMTSGQIFWHGEELLKKERKEISRILSYVAQSNAPSFDFTVWQIVSMASYCHPGDFLKNKCEEQIEWALRTVDAWHLRNKKITQLSSGERQRVYIARALATGSPILLLDEPTNSLDIRHQLEIWELLKTLKNKLIIASTHDLRAAQHYCDDLVLIKEGQCVGVGVPQTIFEGSLINEVFSLKAKPF